MMENGIRIKKILFRNMISERQTVFVFPYVLGLQKFRIGDTIRFESERHETCKALLQESIFFQDARRIFDDFLPIELGYRDEESFFSDIDPEEIRIYGLVVLRISLISKPSERIYFSSLNIRDRISETRSLVNRWNLYGDRDDITNLFNKYKKKYRPSQNLCSNFEKMYYFEGTVGKLTLVQKMVHPFFYSILSYLLDVPEGLIRALSRYERCLLLDEDGIISSFEGYKEQRYFQENPNVLTGSQAIQYLLNRKTMEQRRMDATASMNLSESVYHRNRMEVIDAFISGQLRIEDMFIDFVPIPAFTIQRIHDTERFLGEEINAVCFKIFLRGERIRKMKEKTPIPVILEFYSKYVDAIETLTQMIG